MAGTRYPRYRTSWSSQTAIPRLGFLLFILAVAIVVWPKLRLARETVVRAMPDIDGTPRLNFTDGDPSSIATADDPMNGEDPKKKSDLEKTSNAPGEELAIDGQTRDLLSLVTDNSLRMAKREMPAYWELVRKTANSTFNELREKANSGTKFNDFYSEPAKHRGELVSFDISVRRVTRFEAEAGNSAGLTSVYEIWGSTDQSHAWLYVFITDRLPDGFNEETLLRKKAAFAGYFLKLLAYHPGAASPNAKPLLAPLMIGRFNDIQDAEPTSTSNLPWWASSGVAAFIVLAAVFFTVRIFVNDKQKMRRRRDQSKDLKDIDVTLFESDRV